MGECVISNANDALRNCIGRLIGCTGISNKLFFWLAEKYTINSCENRMIRRNIDDLQILAMLKRIVSHDCYAIRDSDR